MAGRSCRHMCIRFLCMDSPNRMCTGLAEGATGSTSVSATHQAALVARCKRARQPCACCCALLPFTVPAAAGGRVCGCGRRQCDAQLLSQTTLCTRIKRFTRRQMLCLHMLRVRAHDAASVASKDTACSVSHIHGVVSAASPCLSHAMSVCAIGSCMLLCLVHAPRSGPSGLGIPSFQPHAAA